MSHGDVLPQTADGLWKLKFIRKLRLSILVSEKNPRSLYFYENLTVIRKLQVQQALSGSLIIHCFSVFSLYYEMWMGVIFTICLIHFPMAAAFSEKDTHALNYSKTFLDIACWCDIILHFRTAYVDKRINKVVLSPSKIAINYVTSVYFIPDILSSLPSPYLYADSIKKYTHFIALLSLLKIFRLFTAYTYLKRSAQYFNLDRPSFGTFAAAFLFFLIIHWTCCTVYIVPQFRFVITGSYPEKSWVTRYSLNSKTTEAKYIHCFYIASAYILGIKQGLLAERSPEEKVFACILYLGGKIVIFYVGVAMATNLIRKRSLETKYFEVIEELEGFMIRKALPTAIRSRLLQYYNYKFKGKYFEANTIKSIISDRLRGQISLQTLHTFTANVEIFAGLNQETLTKLLSHLQLEIFLPRDLIIKAGGSGECMYFISSGTVAVYTPCGKEVCHLQDGDYFGEIALLIKDQKRTAHVFAVEICAVFRLHRRDFNSCLKPDRDIMKTMMDEALLRMEMMKGFQDMSTRTSRLSSIL